MAISFHILPNGTLQQTGDANHDVFFGDIFFDGAIRLNDRMIGGDGDDVMSPFGGNNVMLGQSGNDTLLIGGTISAWDQAFGGAGNDQFLIQFPAANATTSHIADGGGGYDSISFGTLPGALTLRDGEVSFDGRTIVQMSNIEVFHAGAFNDAIRVTPSLAEVYGGFGNDTLFGWARNGPNPLILAGESGDDRLIGGAADELLSDGDVPAPDDAGGYTDYNDSDTLRGGDGNDTLLSFSGEDTLMGEGGNDVLIIINSLARGFGGDGDDEVRFHVEPLDALLVINHLQEDIAGVEVDGGNGFDTVDFSGLEVGERVPHPTQGLRLLVDRGVGFEQSSGGNGIFFFGGIEDFDMTSRDDIVFGGPDDFSVDAGAGNDFISGGPGNDILDGGPGNDRVLGGNGNNIIHGSEGRDFLGGGDDFDFFCFDVIALAGQGRNRISGFETKGDTADTLVLLGDDHSSPSFEFSDLSFRQLAAGTLVIYQNWDVLLLNVLADSLKESHFAFDNSDLSFG